MLHAAYVQEARIMITGDHPSTAMAIAKELVPWNTSPLGLDGITGQIFGYYWRQ